MEFEIKEHVISGWDIYHPDHPLHHLILDEEEEMDMAIALHALEIIAGEKQCADNLMSNADVARAALFKVRKIRL